MAMKAVLKEKSLRNYLLFTLGINTGLRIGDLLRFKIADVLDENGNIQKYLTIREQKTGKFNSFVLNRTARKAVQEYLQILGDYDLGWYLFKSQKGKNRPISRQQAYTILNEAARVVGIKERIGTHTLRKTFGYWARKNGVASIEQLQEIFNHSSPAVTRRYIGFTQKEKNKIFEDLNL